MTLLQRFTLPLLSFFIISVITQAHAAGNTFLNLSKADIYHGYSRMGAEIKKQNAKSSQKQGVAFERKDKH